MFCFGESIINQWFYSLIYAWWWCKNTLFIFFTRFIIFMFAFIPTASIPEFQTPHAVFLKLPSLHGLRKLTVIFVGTRFGTTLNNTKNKGNPRTNDLFYIFLNIFWEINQSSSLSNFANLVHSQTNRLSLNPRQTFKKHKHIQTSTENCTLYTYFSELAGCCFGGLMAWCIDGFNLFCTSCRTNTSKQLKNKTT